MTYRTKRIIPVIGLMLIIGYAAIRVVSGNGEEIKRPLPAKIGNLAEVRSIEIRDASGQVILTGTFSDATDIGGERERFAQLSPTSVDPDAKGAAEIEVLTGAIAEQEFELAVERLAAAATFTIFIDGQEVTSFTTNARGEAELEMSNEPSK